MRTFAAAVALLLGVGLSPVAAGADEALTNEDVIRLTEAGIGGPVIVARIRTSPTAFDLSVDQLVALAEAGVDDDVLAAMVAVTAGPAAERSPGGAAPPARVARAPETPQNSARPRAIPGSTFRESLRAGGEGPEMVVIPAGRFRMGCLSNDDDCPSTEKLVHEVTIGAPFALSVHEVTFEDYDRFTYPEQGRRPGLGPRPPPGDPGVVERRAGLRGVAVVADGSGVPAAERGGVGVRGTGRDDDEVQLGGRDRSQSREL